MGVTTKKFEGTYHNTVFIRDTETVGLQFAVEADPHNSFDLTIAAIDNKKKRTEFVLTASRHVLQELLNTLQNKLNPKKFA